MAKHLKKLILADGTEYHGYGFGADNETVAEVIFNTSMCGYQEILSDPAMTGKLILMTYPLIGNYGITDEDFESKNPSAGGMIVREYNDSPSNFRYTKTLAETMEENGIPGIAGFDTRALTRHLREHGSMLGIITDEELPTAEALARIRAHAEEDLVARVSCKKTWYARTANHKYTVVALDLGLRLSLVAALNRLGCNVTIVPYNTSAERILAMKPDGVLVSGGPGSPESHPDIVGELGALLGKVPLFATGLGHELVGLAYGGRVRKLKCGHYGTNHPLKNRATGEIETVTQSHSYVLEEESLRPTRLTVTHEDILDGTVAACASEEDRVLTVQYHPTVSVGPHGRDDEFTRFIRMIEEGVRHA